MSQRQLLVQALFDVHYSGENAFDSRQLYQVTCDLPSKFCDGIMLDLDNVDKGRPLSVMDLGRIEGAQLLSFTGSVATIQWGPLRTLTIDLDQGSVRYVESGEGLISGHVEGRGEVTCAVSEKPR